MYKYKYCMLKCRHFSLKSSRIQSRNALKSRLRRRNGRKILENNNDCSELKAHDNWKGLKLLKNQGNATRGSFVYQLKFQLQVYRGCERSTLYMSCGHIGKTAAVFWFSRNQRSSNNKIFLPDMSNELSGTYNGVCRSCLGRRML